MDEEEYNKLSPRLKKRYMKVTYHDIKGKLMVMYTMNSPSHEKLWEMWDKVFSLDND